MTSMFRRIWARSSFGDVIDFPKGHDLEFIKKWRELTGSSLEEARAEWRSFVDLVRYHPVETTGSDDALAWFKDREN